MYTARGMRIESIIVLENNDDTHIQSGSDFTDLHILGPQRERVNRLLQGSFYQTTVEPLSVTNNTRVTGPIISRLSKRSTA